MATISALHHPPVERGDTPRIKTNDRIQLETVVPMMFCVCLEENAREKAEIWKYVSCLSGCRRHRRSSSGTREIYDSQEPILLIEGSVTSRWAGEGGGKSLSSPIQAGEATEPPSLIEEDDEQTITLGSNKLADYCLATEKPCDWVVPLQVKSRGGIVYGVAIESGDTVDLAPLLQKWNNVHPRLLLAGDAREMEEPLTWVIQNSKHSHRMLRRMGSRDLPWGHGTAMQQIELLRRGFFPRRDVIKW